MRFSLILTRENHVPWDTLLAIQIIASALSSNFYMNVHIHLRIPINVNSNAIPFIICLSECHPYVIHIFFILS